MKRDIEELAKEITHNGETFVPICKLAEMEGLLPYDTGEVLHSGDIILSLQYSERGIFVPCKFMYSKVEGIFKLTETKWHQLTIRTHREMRKKCEEWGFEL